jgi:NAD(P)-dependent dehydrogenase (short-subunit alcohol dehydrogenase family)
VARRLASYAENVSSKPMFLLCRYFWLRRFEFFRKVSRSCTPTTMTAQTKSSQCRGNKYLKSYHRLVKVRRDVITAKFPDAEYSRGSGASCPTTVAAQPQQRCRLCGCQGAAKERPSFSHVEFTLRVVEFAMNERAKPPLPSQRQPMPGRTDAMEPRPDHGEGSYRGAGKLKGKRAIITGGDSGIGRAVAIAFAREGADILIAYLDEDDDANETKRLVEQAGRKALLVKGDIGSSEHCRAIVAKAVDELGGVDILVNNAAHQASFSSIEDISDEEWELTFRTNIHAMFYLTKAAVPHMSKGASIINTASINADTPNPTLLAYATTKGAIQNFTAGLAQLLAEKGIRANAVAPGPIWTPLIPSTMPKDAVEKFGANVPMKRPGQPAELATAYVMLADPLSSYVSGATIAVTGGKPML